MKNILTNKWFWIVLAFIVIVSIAYRSSQKKKAAEAQAAIDAQRQILQGANPQTPAGTTTQNITSIVDSFAGLFGALKGKPKTDAQMTATANSFEDWKKGCMNKYPGQISKQNTCFTEWVSPTV